MDAGRAKTIGKFIALILRHQPGELGLSMDGEGWVELEPFCEGMARKFGIARVELLELIERDAKSRYRIEGGRIRASQGHSLSVDLGLAPQEPPAELYHGTKLSALASILANGLDKRGRTHVHLSLDVETARQVAARRKGESVILAVAASAMHDGGHAFHLSENGVWLTGHVPPQFISQLI